MYYSVRFIYRGGHQPIQSLINTKTRVTYTNVYVIVACLHIEQIISNMLVRNVRQMRFDSLEIRK